tara:strand:- start:1030 stop:1287 length:258 start_codon:yes stop_codon:yes gene_type:complete
MRGSEPHECSRGVIELKTLHENLVLGLSMSLDAFASLNHNHHVVRKVKKSKTPNMQPLAQKKSQKTLMDTKIPGTDTEAKYPNIE